MCGEVVIAFISSALDNEVVAHMLKTGSGWQCITCGWETKLRARLWEHVEANHVQTSGYLCPICQTPCPSKNALKVHKSRKHRIVPFNKID